VGQQHKGVRRVPAPLQLATAACSHTVIPFIPRDTAVQSQYAVRETSVGHSKHVRQAQGKSLLWARQGACSQRHARQYLRARQMRSHASAVQREHSGALQTCATAGSILWGRGRGPSPRRTRVCLDAALSAYGCCNGGQQEGRRDVDRESEQHGEYGEYRESEIYSCGVCVREGVVFAPVPSAAAQRMNRRLHCPSLKKTRTESAC